VRNVLRRDHDLLVPEPCADNLHMDTRRQQ
jgi:hypothetical protein